MNAWEQLKIYIEVMPIKNSFILRHIESKLFEPINSIEMGDERWSSMLRIISNHYIKNIEIGDETWSQIIAYQDLN